MRLPNKAKPVARGASAVPSKAGVNPSNWQCDICMAVCDRLSGAAKAACQIACQNTVC